VIAISRVGCGTETTVCTQTRAGDDRGTEQNLHQQEATIMLTDVQTDMFSPDVIADPYGYYGRLRDNDSI
jgi:hypothetical protein